MKATLHIYIMLGFAFCIPLSGVSVPQNNAMVHLIREANNLNSRFSYDSAIISLNRAYVLAEKSNNQVFIAQINRLKGYTFMKKHQYDSAKFYLNRSIHQSDALNNDSIKALAKLNLGWILQQTGRSDSALSYYQDALNLYVNTADTPGMALAYNYLAVYYKFSGDFEKGLENALHANYIFRKSGNLERYANSLIQLGNIYEKLDDDDTALACYEKAYRLGIENDFPRYVISSSVNIAVIHYKRGIKLNENGEPLKAKAEYELAKEYYQKAIDFNEKIQNKSELTILYSNLSILYRRMDDDSAAIESAKKAIRIAQEINNVGAQLRALNNLGICYKNLKDFSKAESCYLKGLALAKKLKYTQELENMTYNLSNVYELQGDYKKALKYSRLAMAYQDTLFNEKKQKLIEEHKTNYEILLLKDQQRITRLKEEKARQERNIIYGVASIVVVILILFFVLFRMRTRKNRIIAEQRIQKLEDEKKLMAAQSVMVGQEKERERIARELHDGIGVLLSTASIHFSSVESKTDKETAEMLKKANKMLREAHKEVRKISHNMMPGVLSKFGLREAIEDLFENVEDAGEIEVDLDITCGEGRLSQNMEIMIYRIIQEMINNTLKHAKATRIVFSVARTEEAVRMEYRDNGIGFDEEKLPRGKNLGLSGIRSRVEYLGGTIELKSEKGKGTSYSVSIPLHKIE